MLHKKSESVTVTLPKTVLEWIDGEAARQLSNRAQVVRQIVVPIVIVKLGRFGKGKAQ